MFPCPDYFDLTLYFSSNPLFRPPRMIAM